MWQIIGGRGGPQESYVVLARPGINKRDIDHCVSAAILADIRNHPDQCVALEGKRIAVVRQLA